MKNKITLTGAGLVGSLLSILLRQRGYLVTVLERRPDMRTANISAGKSINLAMSVRGWAALDMAGLRQEIESIAIPMYGRQIHQTDGQTIFQPYGKHHEAIYSVSRGELNKKLITLAEKEGVRFLFNRRVEDVDLTTHTLHVNDLEKQQTETWYDQDLLIASDGAFSALRQAYVKTDRYNYSQYYIPHGYKELYIPPAADGSFQLEKEALHIWPRKHFMLIALPNFDGSFTCTLFLDMEGEVSFSSLQSSDQILAFFEREFPDTLPLMPTLVEDFIQNPTSSLITVKCFPWVHEDKSMLIGDAAHAIVPFYGQGMNAGFEDCRVFIELLDAQKDPDWHSLLKAYQYKRKPNGDAVADLALQNFIEMRDKVADPVFLKRKHIEKQLGLLFPAQFNSVYEMVSFSHTPYHVALQCQQAQDHLLASIMQTGDFDQLIQQPAFRENLQLWINDYEQQVKPILQAG